METVDREVRLEKQLLRQKRRLSRKEQNSNNSKAVLEKIKKIENKLDNVYNDYMNKCISVVIKSNPSCVVIVENNQKFLQKYYAQFKKIVAFSNLIQRIYHNDIRNMLP